MNLNEQMMSLLSKPAVLIILTLWTIFWKGRALWYAASKKQLVWFITLLVFNTIGLLEIAYIFYLHSFDLDKGRLLAWLEKKKKRH